MFLHGGDYAYGTADGGGTFDTFWYDGLQDISDQIPFYSLYQYFYLSKKYVKVLKQIGAFGHILNISAQLGYFDLLGINFYSNSGHFTWAYFQPKGIRSNDVILELGTHLLGILITSYP